jgi:hypothetical protein
MKCRSLADVLDKLNACKMNSTRKRDYVIRFIKRGALERAVQKCGTDVRRSLEIFKVCTLVFQSLPNLTASADYASG